MVEPIELRYGSQIWAGNSGKRVEVTAVYDPAYLPEQKGDDNAREQCGKPQVFEHGFGIHCEGDCCVISVNSYETRSIP